MNGFVNAIAFLGLIAIGAFVFASLMVCAPGMITLAWLAGLIAVVAAAFFVPIWIDACFPARY